MIRVSSDASHLCNAVGRPWFYLADTAWQLFQSLTLDEAQEYCAVRSAQGFTAIQAVAYPEFGGIETPNRDGHLAMWEMDPAKPNAAYFDHISNVIDVARQCDLVVALLPTWGCHVTKAWATNATAQFTTRSASDYGRFIAQRLGRHDNLIWVIGGDRDVRDAETRQIWDALADSIRAHDPKNHLMTFHPSGGTSSSRWVADADWIDFHMIQSGHTRRDSRNWDLVRRDCESEPRKPVIDGEPCYENHPICFEPGNGWFDEYDVRKAAWRAVLSGACGHAYGCHDVWMMADEKQRPVATSRGNWRASLGLPGAGQMRHLRATAETLLLPGHFNSDVSVVTQTQDSDHISVARNGTPDESDATYLILYFPICIPHVLINLSSLNGNHFRSWWLDPRNGTTLPGDEGLMGKRYTPRFPEGGADWVLVIEQNDN